MGFKDLVEKYAEIKVSQEDIDTHLPQAQRKLELISNREGDSNGVRKKPEYLAMLLGEIINMSRFSDFCYELGKAYKEADDFIQQKISKTKESIQQNAEMLPQTKTIVSQ